jgi:hypothetical protein
MNHSIAALEASIPAGQAHRDSGEVEAAAMLSFLYTRRREKQ